MLRAALRPPALAMRAIGITPPETVFRHLHKHGPFTVRLPAGRGLLRLMSWGNRVENELMWRGWRGHEPETMQWWARIALDADVVLDIGANTATFAYIAKALNPAATVHAFEPLARIAELARENATVSRLDISVFQIAMADKTGELPIYDPGGANAYSASLDADFLKTSADKDCYLVPVTTIDAHCAEHGIDPALIKIDVEGVEGRLIEGAGDTLSRGRVVILCEWLYKPETHDHAITLLAEVGYAALDPTTGQRTNLDDTISRAGRNVILCAEARVEGILKMGPLS